MEVILINNENIGIFFLAVAVFCLASFLLPNKQVSFAVFLLTQVTLSVAVAGVVYITLIVFLLGCYGLSTVLFLSLLFWAATLYVSARIFIRKGMRKSAVALLLSGFLIFFFVIWVYVATTLYFGVSCSGEFLT